MITTLSQAMIYHIELEVRHMRTFDYGLLGRLAVPMHILRLVSAIREMKGKQDLWRQQKPQLLETLRHVALIQSTESSNRIENITIDPRRLRSLMSEKTEPQNRSENEIAGYRAVLDTIHASAAYIPVRPGTILQLHRDLYRFSPGEGGHWKLKDNEIEELLERLCQEFNRAWDSKVADELILLAVFVLDFLCIHPFADGNGRIARLLTLLILYHGGFEVGRFISMERLIEETKRSYYDTLYKSSQNWHEGTNDLIPWLEYFLGVILAAYKEFERRVNVTEGAPGYKSTLVRDTILRIHQPFTMQDLQNACPGIGLPTIRKVLSTLKDEGLIQCIELGRHARWIRT